jgi:hypothetical protein
MQVLFDPVDPLSLSIDRHSVNVDKEYSCINIEIAFFSSAKYRFIIGEGEKRGEGYFCFGLSEFRLRKWMARFVSRVVPCFTTSLTVLSHPASCRHCRKTQKGPKKT